MMATAAATLSLGTSMEMNIVNIQLGVSSNLLEALIPDKRLVDWHT